MSVERGAGYGISQIQEIRRRASQVEGPIILPQGDVYEISLAQRKDMFGLAQEAWRSAFNPQRLFYDLSPSKTELEGIKKRASLKDIRKFGLIVKTGYLLFDERHSAPLAHHVLIKKIGELNDTFAMDGSDVLRKDIENALITDYSPYSHELTLQPASDSSYRTAVEEHLDTIRGGVLRSIVPVSEFHDIRKAVRHFMNVYQLAGALDPTEENVVMFTHLSRLSSAMGSQHDLFVQQGYAGDLDYESADTHIRPQLQERLIQTLSALGA